METTLRTLVQVWRGDRSWQTAQASETLSVSGAASVRSALPRWLGQSRLAVVPRPA